MYSPPLSGVEYKRDFLDVSMDHDLKSHFEHSAHNVRSIVARLETHVLKPASTFAREHPVWTLFLSSLALLSFIPASAFLLCCLFFLTALIISGASLAIISVLFLLSCFLFVFVLNIFASAGFTVLAVSTYLSLRFLVLVYSHGFGGITQFISELQSQVHESRGNGKAPSEGSSESSMVMVEGNEGTSDPAVKSE